MLKEYRSSFCRKKVPFKCLYVNSYLPRGEEKKKASLKLKSWVFCYLPLKLFSYLSYRSFLQLGAGLSVGLSGLAAGFAIGIVGDAGVRGTAQQPRLFVGMILILIFAEVLGLYGLIVALILSTK